METLPSSEFNLQVELQTGKLITNAEILRDMVQEKLKTYTVENYHGDIKKAERDRAELNNTAKMLNSRRLELEREFMKPFNEFKDIINDTVKDINTASKQIDNVIKIVEEQEKEGKKNKILEIWETKSFSLFTLEKVFNKKWLNKTSKLKDIEKDIDDIIAKTFTDLSVIEKFDIQDVPLIKTIYLENLNISEALAKAESLKANREKLANEATERKNMFIQEKLKEQKEEIYQEKLEENLAPLVNEIIGNESEPVRTFALVLSGTAENLIKVKQFMTENSVTYIKLEETESGLYKEF